MMKLKVDKEKENPFLGRKELVVSIEHTGEKTPTRAAVQTLLAKELGAQQDKIEIRKIFSVKGKSESTALVNVWKDKIVGIEKPKEKKEEKPVKEESKQEAVQKEDKKEEKPEEKKSEEDKKQSEKKETKAEEKPAEKKE